MSFLVTCIVLLIAVAAFGIPLFTPTPKEMPFTERDLEQITGPRSIRSLLGAACLLSLTMLATYASVLKDSENFTYLFTSGALLSLLLITALCPHGFFRNILVRILECTLALLGFLFLLGGAFNLWSAASAGRALVPTRGSGKYFASVQSEPGMFWFSVVVAAFMICLVTAFFRAYVLRTWLGKPSDHAPKPKQTPSGGFGRIR